MNLAVIVWFFWSSLLNDVYQIRRICGSKCMSMCQSKCRRFSFLLSHSTATKMTIKPRRIKQNFVYIIQTRKLALPPIIILSNGIYFIERYSYLTWQYFKIEVNRLSHKSRYNGHYRIESIQYYCLHLKLHPFLLSFFNFFFISRFPSPTLSLRILRWCKDLIAVSSE